MDSHGPGTAYECRWVLLGDFNMVEAHSDKNCPCASLVFLWERSLFEAMKAALQVDDSSRTAGSLQFSWNNQQPQLARRLAPLDCIYLFRSNSFTPGRKLLQYVIKRDTVHSYHFPVTTSILLEDSPMKAYKWKMSSFLLEAASPEIISLWQR
jgi:hypothetical protein